MKWHNLKTHPEPLAAIRAGEKTFEFRKNDRDFQPGDKVILHHYDPETGGDITDRGTVVADVGFVLRGPAYGVPEGYCVFSLIDACTEAGLIRRGDRPAKATKGDAER